MSLDRIVPIDSTDKVQQILNSLHSYIIEGHLLPGTLLPSERDLAEKLKVSRFSLREALRVAQAQGLIEITSGRRPRVAELSNNAAADIIKLTLRRSKQPLADLIVARQAIETQIARLAALNATANNIAAMGKTIELILDNQENIDFCVEQDILFHNCLLEAANNIVFEIMLAPLAELLKESRKETLRRGIDHTISGHKEILNMVKKRNPTGALKAMHHHLDMAEEDIRYVLGL
jgi:GntR family transcriptional regulator, transcriptional repressor for pyruvate dehydrogenase complex